MRKILALALLFSLACSATSPTETPKPNYAKDAHGCVIGQEVWENQGSGYACYPIH